MWTLIALLLVAAAPQQSPTIDPPAPVAPAVITRDEARRATIRALRLSEPLRLDGTLDEPVYQLELPIDDFIQAQPKNGEPASERTEAWVMFDAANIYISARCWDASPPGDWIVNEMRRDRIVTNESFGVLLDTFYDRRNGYMFYTTPLGARQDVVITDEGNSNPDWNPVWDVRSGRFEGGWTVEMRIPFKSIRYRSGTSQTWGIQIRRNIRHKNEWVHLTLIPASVMPASQGIQRASMAGTLVGLDLPPASRNIEVKPYAIASLTTDRVRTPPMVDDLDGDIGVDAKFGITANLTADFTYNTDFAQVEIDQQQINLTRFSLFFPEKRDFFLEGRGILDFGRGRNDGTNENVPYVFYSRRIGLNANRVVPIDAGGRLTGKIGRFSLGAMNIQTADDPASGAPRTNFAVLRVKRDVLRKSSVGAIVTNRSASTSGPGSNQAMGGDVNLALGDDVLVGGYAARTDGPGLARARGSYRALFDYGGDRYGATVEQLHVGAGFNPEVGFVRRRDIDLTSAVARFSPRPKAPSAIRQLTWEASLEYIENGAGRLDTRTQAGRFNIELDNSDQFTVDVARDFELLPQPFPIAPGVTVAPGGYGFTSGSVRYSFGTQRPVSGTLSLQQGAFYDGTITSVAYSGGRVSLTPYLSVEPGVTVTRVQLPAGDFTSRLLRARVDYAFSPWMFVSGLVQYSSGDRAFSNNFRFRWEYLPGSELFAVYTDEHDTRDAFGLRNRAFVVKINRLLQF